MPIKCKYTGGCPNKATKGDKITKKAKFCKTHAPKDFISVAYKLCKLCTTRASFGLKGTKKPEYCKKHIPDNNYINVRGNFCKKCGKQALFGKLGSKKGEFCKTHAPIGYINVVSKRCKFKGCIEYAIMASDINKPSEFCKTHAPKNYVAIGKRCKFEGCKKFPNFGKKGGKAKYCKNHAPKEYINVKTKMCLYNDCNFVATCGKKGSKVKEFCNEHAPKNYIDLNKKNCKFLGCTKNATFGLKSTMKREYCDTHKPSANYVNLNQILCIYPECTISASFGLIETKKKEYCSTHKPSDKYINLSQSRCNYLNCPNIAYYGLKETKKKEFCKEHKPSDKYINVSTTICCEKECTVKARYGFPGKSCEFCFTHKKIGTKKNPNKKCIVCKKELAIYGYKDATHCENHKISDQKDLVQKECKSCKLPEILDKDGLCCVCNPETFKNARLVKQKTVKNYFDYIGLKYESYDITIEKGECGKERPDFLFDFNTHFVILEVDEDQHQGRDCSCEQIRMVNIANSLGMKTIFVRWNPDKYKPIKGRRQEKIQNRLETLKDVIEKLKEHKDKGLLFVTYMYFDEDKPEKWLEPIKIE